MDAPTFLGLEATHNPHRWVLPVTPGISTAGNFLFGGCALGACIAALEGTTGRPVVWATAQYLSLARPPSVLDIDVTIAVNGHRVTQARAVGHVADTEIVTVNAALGTRPLDGDGSWEQPPVVPRPADCRVRTYRHVLEDGDTLMNRLEVRLADGRDLDDLDGTPGNGRSALWARLPQPLETSAASLAILGDYVPFGIGQALGRHAGGTSLDNTVRVVQLVPTEWVLVDISVHAIRNGFGHGLVHLWAEDGTLLATASQSCMVRFWAPPDVARIHAGRPEEAP
jgi:acyl-CoA thioesterase